MVKSDDFDSDPAIQALRSAPRLFTLNGTPASGDTYAGIAAHGSVLHDVSVDPPAQYVNTGSLTSPVWTAAGGGTSYPGVTSPGDGQLAAPGGITVGAGGQFSQFTGALAIVSTQTDYSNAQAPLGIEQGGTLDSSDGWMQQSYVRRYIDRNGRITGNPVFEVMADDSTNGTHPVPANEQVFRSSSALGKHVTDYADGSVIADGGVGMWGTTAPSSKPSVTLALSTITDSAVVDAINALRSILVQYGLAVIAED